MTIHEQTNMGGTSTIVPASAYHVEYVTVEGGPSIRTLVLDAAYRDRAGVLEVSLTFDCPAGVQVNLTTGVDSAIRLETEDGLTLTTENGQALMTEDHSSGSVLASVTTDGLQPNALYRFTVNVGAQVKPLQSSIPAFVA